MPSLRKYRLVAFNQQNGRCYYCGLPMWLKNPSTFAAALGISAKEASQLRGTAEHLIAKQEGGPNSRANIVAACLRCNATRHRMPIPLDPNEYHQHVQRRMRAGRWFGVSVR